MRQKVNIYDRQAEPYAGPTKKVSVVIPNYNYENFIIERIDSVLRQSYPIYELIVLDDCSTDDSVQVIKDKLATIKDIKTHFVPNDKNSGTPFAQWQKGMNLAKGDYVWIAEADDSADPRFLETAMAGFSNPEFPDVVISFTDSCRIDENNNVVEAHTRPMIHQEASYFMNGIDEIKRCFAISNTIFNVSGVVIRKGNYDEFFEEAKKFKVAGDWYLYYRLLEQGDIAYNNHPLNYFRKHSKSASTVVRDDVEYQEIRRIQDEIAKKYPLSNRILKEQRARLNVMDQNVSKNVHKKRIAWIVPEFCRGSGGHRTIFQNVNTLAKAGYECDIYAIGMGRATSDDLMSKITEYYEYPIAEVYAGFTPQHQNYDLCFCTGWQTIDAIELFDCKKAYFIQDFEPWFFTMGGAYLLTENSYKLGYSPVTIGRWLSHKMSHDYQSPSLYFDFCADASIYLNQPDIKKENAICAIYQPEKSRRCQEILVPALKIVQKLRPETKIYLYGTKAACPHNLTAEMVGMVSPEACCKLYNKCRVGISMSASNPSRIPFEMMATGLPVVDLYLENNLYDLPDTATSLASPSPDAVAAAIIKLLDDKTRREKMSAAGIKYMKDRPIEHGYDQFIKAVGAIIDGEHVQEKSIESIYKQKAISPTPETTEVLRELKMRDLEWIQGRQNIRKSRKAQIKDLGYRALRKGYRILRKYI